MTSQLQTSLQAHIQPGWRSNPATSQIIHGYALYHAVLAITGSVFLLSLVWLSTKFWLRFKKIPQIQKFTWSFEKKIYFCLATVFTLVALFLALIVAANVSTAARPLPGFTGSLSSLQDNSYNRQLHTAFTEWIDSGKTTPPPLVQQRIHHRRIFHIIRVIASGILLATFTVISLRLWKPLLTRRSSKETAWSYKEALWLVAASTSVIGALLMMIIFMANLQSAVVPIANTLQFG